VLLEEPNKGKGIFVPHLFDDDNSRSVIASFLVSGTKAFNSEMSLNESPKGSWNAVQVRE
jgi:hypothetical protein